MSRLMLVAAVILGLYAFAALTVSAADTPAGQSKVGTIKSIDATAKTFVLTIEGKPALTFKFDDKTAYTLDGKEAKQADVVKEGAAVTVTYTRNGQERTATKVEATIKKEAPKSDK
jgi:hypothetical protein